MTSDAGLPAVFALIEGGALEEAKSRLDVMHEQWLDDVAVLNALGVVRMRQGELAEAAEFFRRVLRVLPDHGLANFNLARALTRQNRSRDALVYLQRALDAMDDKYPALEAAALIYRDLGVIRAFLEFARRLTKIAPRNPHAWRIFGEALINDGQADEAIAAYGLARVIAPNDLVSHLGLGVAYQFAGRLPEAAQCFQQAAKLDPDNIDPAANLFGVLWSLGLFDQLERLLAFMLRRAPNDADVVMAAALNRLAVHPDRLAWEAYEARVRCTSLIAAVPAIIPSTPEWDGNVRPGARLLILGEQGLGDVCFFARYLSEVARRVGSLVLSVSTAAMPLLRSLGSGVELDVWHRQDGELPIHDAWVRLGSLPLRLGQYAPVDAPRAAYLGVPPGYVERWRELLPDAGTTALRRARIGVVWKGERRHIRDRSRSIGLARLLPLIAATPADFYSLQPGLEVSDPDNLHDLGPELHDLADSAAAMARLDLVISVDTAVANLAGAVGVPAWVLLDVGPDWRWGRQGDTSPWYPGIRLFRQQAAGDWEDVLTRLSAALAEWRRVQAYA